MHTTTWHCDLCRLFLLKLEKLAKMLAIHSDFWLLKTRPYPGPCSPSLFMLKLLKS